MTSKYKLCVFREEDREVYGTAFIIVEHPSEADVHVLDGQVELIRLLLDSRDLLMRVEPYFAPPPVVVASGDPALLALAAEKKLCCITKPFLLEELVDLVHTIVNWNDEVRKNTFLGDKEH